MNLPKDIQDSLDQHLENIKPVESDALIPVGEVVNGWKVLALLGKGGQGEVYRVQHERFKVCAALKVCSSYEEGKQERFLCECDILRVQTQSCFPRFIEDGKWGDHHYMIIEELEEFELPHKDPEVTKFILAVCHAIASLHAEGFVHRDLKPGNVMRRKDGSYVLIDLGLAKSFGNCLKSTSELMRNCRSKVGTEGFSAPEQFVSGDANAASDIHSIGAIIYKCFDGNPPRQWVPLVNKATSSLNSQRYQHVKELIDDINSASAVRPISVKRLLLTEYSVFLSWFVITLLGAITTPVRGANPGSFAFLFIVEMILGCIVYGLNKGARWGWISSCVLNAFLLCLTVIGAINMKASLAELVFLMTVVGASCIPPLAFALDHSSRAWFRYR